jgi:diphthamide synthase (EF-2-diphthine--ammonia ligase)
MPKRPKALIAWSSGKDSAFALHEARRAGDYEIVGALTTVTDTFARVSMHGVRESLLAAQLAAARLPSIVVLSRFLAQTRSMRPKCRGLWRRPKRTA